MLQPSVDVYILPLSFVDYQVERRKRGKSEVVPMPSDQYTLELTNYTVGELDTQKSRVTGLVVGYTEAVLQDKSILYTLIGCGVTPTVHVAILYSEKYRKFLLILIPPKIHRSEILVIVSCVTRGLDI